MSERKFKRGDEVWVAFRGKVINSCGDDGYRVSVQGASPAWRAVVPASHTHCYRTEEQE